MVSFEARNSGLEAVWYRSYTSKQKYPVLQLGSFLYEGLFILTVTLSVFQFSLLCFGVCLLDVASAAGKQQGN